MSKGKTGWDDLAEPAQNMDEGVELEPGEFLIGKLITREVEGAPYGDDRLSLIVVDSNLDDVDEGDVARYHATGQVVRQLDDGGLEELDVIGLRKSETENSFTDDEGEEVTYNPIEVRAAPQEGDD